MNRRLNSMTRTECIEKIKEVSANLELMCDIMQLPGATTIADDCEVYIDEIQSLTDVFNTLRERYGYQTKSEFNKGLINEKQAKDEQEF